MDSGEAVGHSFLGNSVDTLNLMMTEQKTLVEPVEEDFYTVDIEQFEGPLNLLLSLIRKSEIDIYDIPVAEISEQYDRRLEIMEKRSFDNVAQYLPLLAELGLIKSRMLLPKTDEEDKQDPVDPRMELARRLIVYERFRDAAVRMGHMILLGRDVFPKGLRYSGEFGEPEVETEVVSGVWPLIVSLCEMRARINQNDKENLRFTIDPVSVEERMIEIHSRIREEGIIEDFNMLFDDAAPSKSRIAVSFVAILELARKEVIELFQKKPFSTIKLLYSERKNDGKDPYEKTD